MLGNEMRIMKSLSAMIMRNQGNAAGIYNPNHFLITIDASNRFIEPDNPNHPNMRYMHIFLHEYWHYLQNVTTFTGYKSFDFTQHILAIFSKTLMQKGNGTSAGSGVLGADDKEDTKSLLALQSYLDGEGAPSTVLLNNSQVDFTVVGTKRIDRDQTLYGRAVPNPLLLIECDCIWPDGHITRESMQLGTWAIEESVAYIITKQVLTSNEIPSTDIVLPAFPYRVLEKLFDYLIGPRDQTLRIDAALGTLALLTTHPGSAIMQLVEGYKIELRRKSESEALNTLIRNHIESTEGIKDVILKREIPSMREMHKGRGLSEGAINYITDTIVKGINHRMTSPLFDIDAVYPVKYDEIQSLQRMYPPCDILQENLPHDGSFPRDTLYSFHPATPGTLGPSDYVRSLHAQQDFVFAHMRMDGTFKESSQCEPHICPYYYCCSREPRRNNPATCQNRPWMAYDLYSQSSCWYTNGVVATLGIVTIGK